MTTLESFVFYHPVIQYAAWLMICSSMAGITYRCQCIRIIGSSSAAVIYVVCNKLYYSTVFSTCSGFCMTASALVAVSVKDIRFYIFIVILWSTLIQLTVDFRVLHSGGVKSSNFQNHTGIFWKYIQEAVNPSDMMICLRLERWRKPSFRTW